MSYLALWVSSNLLLWGCENAASSVPRERVLDEPRILSTANAPALAVQDAGVWPAFETEVAERHRCYAGYRPSGRAPLDLLRLGALCGPSNGLAREPAHLPSARPLPTVSASEDDSLPTPSPSYTVKLSAGECVWAVFATDASRPEAELEPRFELQWLHEGEVIAECQAAGAGMCPSKGPLCAARAGAYELSFEEPPNGVQVQLWRRSSARSGR